MKFIKENIEYIITIVILILAVVEIYYFRGYF